MNFIHIAFLLILSIPIILYPQSQEIEFEHITKEQGLSTNRVVREILQDHNGFMWFGTEDGLNKYDGYKFRIYRHDPDDPNSISAGTINALLEDSEQPQVLWIGTARGGLNRFDTETEIFSHFQHDPVNPNSLNDNAIYTVLEDAQQPGMLWIGTLTGGLNKFDTETKTFTHYKHDPENPNSLSENFIWTLFQDRSGVLWIGTGYGGLNKFDRQTETFTHYKHDPNNPNSINDNWVNSIYEDYSGKLWIGTQIGGLNIFDPRLDPGKAAIFSHYKHDPHNSNSLSSNGIGHIYEDRSKRLWFGGGGLNKLIVPGRHGDEGDAQQFDPSFIHYKHDPRNPNSLSDNGVWSIYQDRWGVIWIGTFEGGLNKFDPGKKEITHYKHDPDNLNSLSHERVNSIYEDRSGILWIGTHGDGLSKFDRESGSFSHYKNDPDKPGSLSDNHVTAIYEDRSGCLWIGTGHGGLNKFDRETGTFTHYKHDPQDPHSLSSKVVSTIYEAPDEAGKLLWIGTAVMGGLNKFDRETETFIRYKHDPDDPQSLSHNNVYEIYKDHTGLFWIGTSHGGLNKFDPETETFTHYKHDPHDPNSLSSDWVTSIYEDQQQPGILWIGGRGLNRFDIQAETFRHYREKDGLPGITFYEIVADDEGNLWIHTQNGLYKFNIETETFKKYDVYDRLQTSYVGDQLLHRSNNSGEIYIAGRGSFYVFHPDSIRDDPHVPPIMITDFQIFNKAVAVGKPDSPLGKSIAVTDEIVLRYDQNTISFEFAALHYTAPEKHQYAYKMEGIDPEWVYTDASRRFASYTQMDPGDYVFCVKGTNHDLTWNDEGTSIRITITPPFWQTWWAYALYVILLGMVIYALRRYDLNRQRIKHELNLEHIHTEKLEEIDQMKSHFYANISHEFRTPLTLILGPLEQMLSGEFTGNFKEQYRIMKRNGQRLLQLINQLLDLSKLESGKMRLHVSKGNIITFLKQAVASFESLAKAKEVILKFQTPSEPLLVYFDRDKLQKIVTNLLSNAFKFTPEGGEIVVEIYTPLPSASPHASGRAGLDRGDVIGSPLRKGDLGGCKNSEGGCLVITISNTGPGIPPARLDKIFDRFYQVDDSVTRKQEGTGIGLALTKELIEVHHGSINVESTDKGNHALTTFTVEISLDHNEYKPEEIVEEEAQVPEDELHPPNSPFSKGEAIPPHSLIMGSPISDEGPHTCGSSTLEKGEIIGSPLGKGDIGGCLEIKTSNKHQLGIDKPLLLIVEDNPDLAQYITSFMQDEYRVIKAENGAIGIKRAFKEGPDLVISDVMMPVMDGYELCQKIKSDERTSHIPVILLTAKADMNSKIEGLELGADDYVAKPFDATELKARVNNLIEQRKTLREKFSRVVEFVPAEIAASSMDEQFLRRVLSIFNKHIDDPDYSTDNFAREIGLSRSQLSRKIKAITNLPTHHFILALRLKRAARLLKKNAGTVSEIAYQVGFNSPSHFTKVFHKEFGQTPSSFSEK